MTPPPTFRDAADAWCRARRAWREAWAVWHACQLGSDEERRAWARQQRTSYALARAYRTMEAAAEGGG